MRSVRPWGRWLSLGLLMVSLLAVAGCDDDKKPVKDKWGVVAEITDAALFAVHGTSASNVWMVGADDGAGPVVLQFDGSDWTRHDAGVRGDLWWVQTFDDGTVFMAGTDAHVLRYKDGAFERLKTPGLGKTTIFGVFGLAPDDVYAVGSAAGRNGFLWHFDGTDWSDVPMPADISLDIHNDLPGLTKVWGASAEEIFVVGDRGTLLRGNRKDGLKLVKTDTTELLFTVHGDSEGQRVVVVGGSGQGVAMDVAQSPSPATLPEATPLLQGVWVTPKGVAWASGGYGQVFKSSEPGEWVEVDHGLVLSIQSLHAVWVDPDGGVWTVGGNVLAGSLDGGVALHNRKIKTIEIKPDPPGPVACPPEAIDPHPEGTIARRWNEQLLNAIRRDTPRPTVHARNLFHLSALLWDLWVSYVSESASSYLVSETLQADDADKAMDEAMSYGAYRLLTHRYATAIGGKKTTACLDAFMTKLGYDITDQGTDGSSPRAVGNRFAEAYIKKYANDGANESEDYADPSKFKISQPRLVVDIPGSGTANPLKWQQLVLAEAITQNGIPEGSGIREYIGAHWGDVTPFAMVRPVPGQSYYTLDNAPTVLDDSLLAQVMDVLRRSAWLDVDDPTTMDISPASMGNNPLGTGDGKGYDKNPVTDVPYQPIVVKRSDFGRVLAEFWADGPDSETPPGHWNTIANLVTDDPQCERKLYGQGASLDPLAWDVHLYFAVNGALHDAAIGAWELKREYLTSRPITLIRTLGARGQRSDPSLPSYNQSGLPLEPGLVELITEETVAAGAKHAHLSRYVGELALWSWRGEPGDRDKEFGGHGWIRAKEWISYQRRTFVSPAFPGYISGHSTFSRAAAEVLTKFTGSPYFPGGSSELTFDPGFLVFESGPSASVTLRWATYFDAADQAGVSRLWGGIHVAADDFDGRIIGSKIGLKAMDLAKTYFDGSAVTKP